MESLPFIILGILVGSSLAIQAGVNSQLRAIMSHPAQAAFISFFVGTVALAAYAFSLRLAWPMNTVMKAPWWIWTGGLLGAYVVTATVVIAPRLGSSVSVGLIVGGQMLASLLLDHYGLVGFPVRHVTPGRIVGAILLMAGVVLIQRF